MANEKHLLLTCQGDYNDSPNSAEGWQVGIRLCLSYGSVDDVGTLPSAWGPEADTINRTETNWTITGNWEVNQSADPWHPDDYLNDVAAPAFAAWLSGIPASWNKTRIRSLKISPIGTNGRAVPAPPYASGTPCLLTWTSSYPVGSNSSDPLPLQNSEVVSHRTLQTGRAGRGRMYLPAITESLTDTHGQISSSNCTDIAANQVTLLESLSQGSGVPATWTLRPIVTGGNWTRYGVITQVKVGNIIDTQRRRRRSLTETYISDSPSY